MTLGIQPGPTRRVFYSFDYERDATRVARVRNIGRLQANTPATDNDWETIIAGRDPAIRRWIDDQMQGRTCCIVMIGQRTAGRKWINYEIEKAWRDHLGLVGVYVHSLKDLPRGGPGLFGRQGQQSPKGANPFEYVTATVQRKTRRRILGGPFAALSITPRRPLSDFVETYDPPGLDSRLALAYISAHLETWIEKAIFTRNLYA